MTSRSPARWLLVLALAIGCGTASAPPPEHAPTAQPADARPSDQGGLARLARTWPDGGTRTYAIRWTSPGTTWLYDGTLTLTRTGASVRGFFEWRLVSANATFPELAAREGSTAIEEIAGSYDPTVDALVMRTMTISDESLVGSASYRLSIAPDGLHGITAGVEDGIWDGVLEGVPSAP